MSLSADRLAGSVSTALDSVDRPARGEIWLTRFGAAATGEPSKTRPAVVVSATALHGPDPWDLVCVVPLSASANQGGLRPRIGRRDGLDRDSVAMCRAVVGLAPSRLLRRLARLEEGELDAISEALSVILCLV
ncbi:MAG: type II toxin-antitoxin system PemK/MazF family toxin [Bifidobacteriaceae bacterium]|jgi:mRNA-degrading endonuclease toxin of MazEF toxin-antitoxin module|nr:type II toxin-antitoxin system PemK/MazF family toxin [Bifidobacteriaceae bacterium]